MTMEEIVTRDSKLLALMEKTGYNIVQENGQRKYGPPPSWIGPPPPKGSEIFVGKLPRDLYEDELVPLFEKVGMIYELRLMMDFCGSNRGYGFVTYTNNDDAQRAIKELNDFEIRRGRRIGVCKSVDNCRLFIGGIPKHKNKDEIKNEISKYTEGVSSVILYNSVTDKSKNRGFAFVEYENHRAAAMARRKLIPGRITLFDNEIAVDWAEPEPQVEEDTMKRSWDYCSWNKYSSPHLVTVLYVRNLSMLTTEDDLRLLFSLGGALKVEKVKKIRDFAFVHYSQRAEAERALTTLDGTSLNNCEIEVTWAKPPESQKLRSGLKPDGFLNQYGQTSFDSFDHATDLNLSQSSLIPGYSCLPRTSSRNLSSRFQAQNYMNTRNSVGIKPTQLLIFVCHEKGWGDPVFHVQHISSDSIDGALLFACKVTIPGLPLQVNQFFPNKVCRSPDEARSYAAQYVLKKIGFSSDYHDFPVVSPSPSLSFSNSHGYLKNISPTSNSLGLDIPSSLQQMPYSVLKSQMRSPLSYTNDILDRGQGDTPSFMPSLNNELNLNNTENLLDPNMTIEPTSILGLLAAAAAAANIELPIFK